MESAQTEDRLAIAERELLKARGEKERLTREVATLKAEKERREKEAKEAKEAGGVTETEKQELQSRVEKQEHHIAEAGAGFGHDR